ncbi:MAG TPA: peroxide stress protein YaaA [Rhodocyclaceae bacterium]|nr:peroxide stress protein YaaA [Rhodocyclaceae bacterium]HRQ47290.1 peroxide stress protein YaaA [Rhodocyclaceae bacterium]
MILVISPAKALDFETRPVTRSYSQPDYLEEAESLIGILRQMTPAEVAGLMDLSDKLATLNVARYETWSRPFSPDNARQAVLAFNGDVYDGLDASSLSEADLLWAQRHLRILSGLYGLLRPLDLMQAYRLEMGSRLANPAGQNLYAYWGDKLTLALNHLLDAEDDAGREPVLVNLASSEYFKSVRVPKLAGRLVSPVFEDWKDGRYRIISFHAKRARGLMTRYAIRNRIEDVDALKGFDSGGYVFSADASDEARVVFRRRLG